MVRRILIFVTWLSIILSIDNWTLKDMLLWLLFLFNAISQGCVFFFLLFVRRVYTIGLQLNFWRVTQFSSNPNQTHLIQLIKVFSIIKNFQAGVIWIYTLQSCDPPGVEFETTGLHLGIAVCFGSSVWVSYIVNLVNASCLINRFPCPFRGDLTNSFPPAYLTDLI